MRDCEHLYRISRDILLRLCLYPRQKSSRKGLWNQMPVSFRVEDLVHAIRKIFLADGPQWWEQETVLLKCDFSSFFIHGSIRVGPSLASGYAESIGFCGTSFCPSCRNLFQEETLGDRCWMPAQNAPESSLQTTEQMVFETPPSASSNKLGFCDQRLGGCKIF